MKFNFQCGIYAIRNKVNGKIYIGSTVSFCRRLSQHRKELERGKHGNIHLQRAYDFYGVYNLEYLVIELCPQNKLIVREKHYIDTLSAEYNIDRDPTRKNYSKEDRKRISDGIKRKIAADPGYLKRREAARCAALKSPELRKRWSDTHMGILHKEKTKKKISKGLKAIYASGERKPTEWTPERKSNMSAKKTGTGTRPVQKMNNNGEIIKEYPSILSVIEDGYSYKSIGRVCRGGRPKNRGFVWRFKP